MDEVDQSHASHKLIAGALKSLRVSVSEAAESVGSEWARRLLDLSNFLAGSVRVVAVEVPTEADAYLIFETLNDRGADLTIADLLKNYLFERATT